MPTVRGTLAIRPIAHVHALFFYGWLLLFLKQSGLRRQAGWSGTAKMGVLGVAVATGMCFVGLAMAVDSIRTMDAAGFGDAGRRFAIVPVTAIALFAVMVAVALLNVSRPEVTSASCLPRRRRSSRQRSDAGSCSPFSRRRGLRG